MTVANLTTHIRDVADGVRVIDISGEITSFSEEEISGAHARAADGSEAVIFNFTDLEYMNSGGIGLLVTILIRAQRSGQALRAYGLSEHYRQIFNLTRLDEAIGIYDDEEAAIAG
jgi:anti-sigma B factor antagonist